MKRIQQFFLIVCLSFALVAETSAQTCIIKHTTPTDLTLNDKALSGMTTNKLVNILGEASRTVEKGTETSYFYDSLGVVFSSIDSVIKGIGINFNWDGDTHFPSTTYKGTLEIGELSITASTTKKAIEGIKKVPLKCPIPIICGTQDRTASIQCSVAFEGEKITQALILLR